MVFLFTILGIALLLCLGGCICFTWRLHISNHSMHSIAVVHDVIREYRTYRPGGWWYRAHVCIMFNGEQIERKLFFWASKDPVTLKQEDYHIPVLININKGGKVRVMTEDKKSLLIFLISALGVMALIFGSVISLIIIYNFK